MLFLRKRKCSTLLLHVCNSDFSVFELTVTSIVLSSAVVLSQFEYLVYVYLVLFVKFSYSREEKHIRMNRKTNCDPKSEKVSMNVQAYCINCFSVFAII